MKPSSLSTLAIATFILEAGIATASCFACTPLRILVSISATGSVMLTCSVLAFREWKQLPCEPCLPTGLGYPRDLAFESELAEANSTKGELADVAPRPAAQLAAVAFLHRVLGRPVALDDHRDLRHAPLPLTSF